MNASMSLCKADSALLLLYNLCSERGELKYGTQAEEAEQQHSAHNLVPLKVRR